MISHSGVDLNLYSSMQIAPHEHKCIGDATATTIMKVSYISDFFEPQNDEADG